MIIGKSFYPEKTRSGNNAKVVFPVLLEAPGGREAVNSRKFKSVCCCCEGGEGGEGGEGDWWPRASFY